MYVNEEFESMYLRECVFRSILVYMCYDKDTDSHDMKKNIGTRWKYHAVNMQKVTKIRYGC